MTAHVRQVRHIRLSPPLHDRLYAEELAQALATLAMETAAGGPAPRVLDVGCGRGEMLRAVVARGGAAIGTDVNVECARLAVRHAPVVVADMYTLDRLLPPRSFDVVVASHVLEHLENPRRAVEILAFLSRRWLVLAVPNLLRPVNWFLRTPRPVNEGHLQGWDCHHFRTFLESGCGLRIACWGKDRVVLQPFHRTPLVSTGLLRIFERDVLGRLFPQMRNSVIVVAEIPR